MRFQQRRELALAPADEARAGPYGAPGTGAPEAGGLSSRELLKILRGLTRLNVVGADVVEVAPAYDHGEITTLAAATVIFDVITLLSRRR